MSAFKNIQTLYARVIAVHPRAAGKLAEIIYRAALDEYLDNPRSKSAYQVSTWAWEKMKEHRNDL